MQLQSELVQDEIAAVVVSERRHEGEPVGVVRCVDVSAGAEVVHKGQALEAQEPGGVLQEVSQLADLDSPESLYSAYHKPVEHAVRELDLVRPARLGEPIRVHCPSQLLGQLVKRGEEEGERRYRAECRCSPDGVL